MIAHAALGKGFATGALALVGATAALSSLLFAREPDTRAARATPIRSVPAEVVLVQATSGAALNDMQAIGDQAKLINAALPFANEPLRAARSFVLRGDDLDQQRALLCLTQAVYYEAGYEPMEGRRAVAQVVLNRMRHPAFPKSICGVVYQGAGTGTCQFTFVCDGALYRRPAATAWYQAEQIAQAALEGYVDKGVGEATHYHADYVVPRWAPLLAKVAAIGQHIFYRWPGGWGQPAAFNGRYVGEPYNPLTMLPEMPAAVGGLATASAEVVQIDSAPPIAVAPDDVGGLLDTSKDWASDIPLADQSVGADAAAISDQQAGPSPTAEVAPAGGLAGRR